MTTLAVPVTTWPTTTETRKLSGSTLRGGMTCACYRRRRQHRRRRRHRHPRRRRTRATPTPPRCAKQKYEKRRIFWATLCVVVHRLLLSSFSGQFGSSVYSVFVRHRSIVYTPIIQIYIARRMPTTIITTGPSDGVSNDKTRGESIYDSTYDMCVRKEKGRHRIG